MIIEYRIINHFISSCISLEQKLAPKRTEQTLGFFFFKEVYMVCIDSRPCFARKQTPKGDYGCAILTTTYKKDGECPFCKEMRNVTNGVYYPYVNPENGRRETCK